MDFSWGWVKPGSAIARPAMPQAKRRPIAASRSRVERREKGWHQRLRLLAPPA